jgi:PAS domain S-box-containing protein
LKPPGRTGAKRGTSLPADEFLDDQADRQVSPTLISERLFTETMIESMPGILYFYDAAGHFLRWNRNLEVVSGYSGDEIAGMHPHDFFEGENKVLVDEQIAAVLTCGASSVQAALVAKDGRATPYYFTGRQLSFEGKQCLIGVGVDITERTEATRAWWESEARYRRLFELAPDGILIADSESRYLDANASICKMLGFTYEELIGLGASDIVVPSEVPYIELALKSLRQKSAHRREWTFRRKDDSTFHAEVTVTVLPNSNLMAMIRDVTDRKLAESERDRRHRAESADRIKSAFLATMSHELRTPLNSIIGFTGIMLQGLAGPLNAEQDKQLGMVQTSARHLLALVNDVLDISRIEAGQLEVSREPFDPGQSINKVVDIVRPQAATKHLELQVEIVPGLVEIMSDGRRFEQILLNLLSNAIKFTDHGKIALSAAPITDFIRSGEEIAEPAIQVRVRDSGIGIKAEDLAALFQPFSQLDSGLSRNHEGTGLGLAISHRLTKLLGGTICAESIYGQGSVFTVTIPIVGRAVPLRSPYRQAAGCDE